MYYYVKINYNSGTPFRGFFNNFLFDEIPAHIASFYKFFCESFFITGENSLTLAWGPLPGDKNWDENNVMVGTPPPLQVSLHKIANLGDEGDVIFEKTLTEKNLFKKDGIAVPAYRVRFDNPTGLNFSPLFYNATRCNESEQVYSAKLPQMRKFCRNVYSWLLSGNIAEIVKASQIRLEDDAKAKGKNLRELSDEYREVMTEIHETGIGYSLNNEEQIVLLPASEGRLWRMVVVKSLDEAVKTMKEIGMLPNAVSPFDHELIESKQASDMFIKLPSYLAEIDGKFCIVR